MFTEAEFVAAVRAEAALNPDKVYEKPEDSESCVYVEPGPDGKLVGSCLLGCALVRLGVNPERMAWKSGVAFATVNETLELGLSGPVWSWANWAQYEQDSGTDWGMSVQKADEHRPIPEGI